MIDKSLFTVLLSITASNVSLMFLLLVVQCSSSLYTSLDTVSLLTPFSLFTRQEKVCCLCFCLTWLFSFDILPFDALVNELDRMVGWAPAA